MGDHGRVTAEALQNLTSSLRPGERLLWQGGPDPAVLFTRQDLFLVPFTLLWAGFTCTWEVTALTSGAPEFALFGIPFVLIGLYMVAGRFVFKRRQKRRTVYAVTSQRALAVTGARNLQDVALAYQPVDVRKSKDLSHVSVQIGSGNGRQDYGNTGLELFSRGSTRFALWDVADVQGLLGALDQARGDQPATV